MISIFGGEQATLGDPPTFVGCLRVCGLCISQLHFLLTIDTDTLCTLVCVNFAASFGVKFRDVHSEVKIQKSALRDQDLECLPDSELLVGDMSPVLSTTEHTEETNSAYFLFTQH